MSENKEYMQAAKLYWESVKTNLEQDIIDLVEEGDHEDCRDQILVDVEELSKVERVINLINKKNGPNNQFEL